MPHYDPDAAGDLRDRFDARVGDWSGVTAKTMFGCPSYRADGTIFAVLVTDGVTLTRLPDDRRDALAAEFETGTFDAGGRTPAGWVRVVVDPDDLDALLPHVRASYEAARDES